MNNSIKSSFREEMSKISEETKNERLKKFLLGTALLSGGTGLGYGTSRYAIPALYRKLGRPAPNISPRSAKIIGGLSGLSLLLGMGLKRVYVDSISGDSGKNHGSGTVQSKNGKLVKRHQGHPPKVLPGVLLPNAGGQPSVPPDSGRRVADVGKGKRSDNIGLGGDKYRYNRKKTGDIDFERGIRVQQFGDG